MEKKEVVLQTTPIFLKIILRKQH